MGIYSTSASMAQAYVNFVKEEGLYIERTTDKKVVCRLGVAEEIIITKSKGEIKIVLKNESKRTTLSENVFNKIYNLGESIHLLISFLKGTNNVS